MSRTDQIIEEVRRARRRMSEESGHDPKRLIQLLQHYNRRYSAQVQKYRRLGRGHASPTMRRR